tara:strand:- start:176 stop:1099 length:924 start_codon:yes stop_codon:yes gene_type:complete
MSTEGNSKIWNHEHSFGQDKKRSSETRTIIVILITASMMCIEIVAGLAYGSMALLADGLHMASHTAALSISAYAYYFARKRAHDRSFSFGTGKVNSLGGYTGAILLLIFALMMVYESIHRLLKPEDILYNQAILVAVIGLIVNGASMLILGHDEHHHHGHDHHGHDHNLRAAYLHVLADTLTSFLAIIALLAAKFYAWNWMDPIMGIIGAILITKWSIGLLKQSGNVLLDRQGPDHLVKSVEKVIKSMPSKPEIVDLHIWLIGPNIFSAAITVLANEEKCIGCLIKSEIKNISAIVHTTIEVHQCSR